VFCRSLFVLFLLYIVLSVLLRFTASYYPFDIFKLCFSNYVVLFHFHLRVCVHSVFVTIAIWFLPLLDILQWSRYVVVHRQMSKINSYKKKIENTKGGNQKSYDRNYNSQQKQKNDLQNTTRELKTEQWEPHKHQCELVCSGGVGSSCSTICIQWHVMK
jgi:hypothetical protein